MAEPARFAGGADRDAVAGLFARAFQDDPAMRWVFPDPAARARRLPLLFRVLFDSDAGGMRLLTADGEAATLWRGPGRIHTGWAETMRRLPTLVWALGPGLRRALAVGNAIDAHMPAGDYWYLHMAGCDPAHQGRGHGAAAVRAGLKRAAGRLPAYLETANERNLGFYAGLGFAVTGVSGRYRARTCASGRCCGRRNDRTGAVAAARTKRQNSPGTKRFTRAA